MACNTLEYSCWSSHIDLNISVTVKSTQSSVTHIYMYIIFYYVLIIKVLQTSPNIASLTDNVINNVDHDIGCKLFTVIL